MREVKPRKPPFKIPPANLIDRAVSYISAAWGRQRMQDRYITAMTGAYYGGSKKRRALTEWLVADGDADSDIIPDLPTMRERSRDLSRNNPLAGGIIKTKTTSIVGTGLRQKCRINREILGLSETAADEWEHHTETEFALFAESTDCDVEDTQNFYQKQDMVIRSTLENGDVFVLTPVVPSIYRPYALQLQLIEADRVCNENNAADSDTLAGGVERREYGGAPWRYHIMHGHPGNYKTKTMGWDKIETRGKKTNRRNVLHIYRKLRVGQSRGVPDLAPVIESLKQLGRFSDAYIADAVISSFFTVFVKSEMSGGEGISKFLNPMAPTRDIGGKPSDKDFKMGSAAILDLAPGEDVEFANPARPNQAFDHFVLAMSRQIGVAVELPFEILVKHFTASFSAAKAAMMEAWRFYISMRKWLADVFCRPVYELWLTEAVAIGRVAAPGFLTGDPLIRNAWLGTEWIGSAKGAIDEHKEVKAASDRVEMGVSTLDEETVALTGGDWEKKHRQRAKEVRMRREDKIENTQPAGAVPAAGGDDETVVPDQSAEEQKG